MKKIIQTLQQPVDRKELNKTLENSQKDNDFITDVSGSFKVGTYSLYKQGDSTFCHWSEGLKMVIEKDGVVIKLKGEEIKKLVDSLPRTFGGVY